MCGRAAQTAVAVAAAARTLGIDEPPPPRRRARGTGAAAAGAPAGPSEQTEEVVAEPPKNNSTEAVTAAEAEAENNYNMSPGMDAVVMWRDASSGRLRLGRKRWGLVSRPGSRAAPLPLDDMGLHFTNMMFNARSDTLWSKPTFARLAGQGRSCLVAMDGFFEWKGLTKGEKKQPYLVFRNQPDDDAENTPGATTSKTRPYLLMAGLWTSVATGRDGAEEDATLDTFTILTTDACKPLQWLHTRMPLCIWDDRLALEWLRHPSGDLLRRLEQACAETPETALQWHEVSPDMTSLKYRSPEAIKPRKGPKKITSFFHARDGAADPKPKSTPSMKTKRLFDSDDGPQPAPKMLKVDPGSESRKGSAPAMKKKGPLDSFFAPKNSL